jgi:hypothetical protein
MSGMPRRSVKRLSKRQSHPSRRMLMAGVRIVLDTIIRMQQAVSRRAFRASLLPFHKQWETGGSQPQITKCRRVRKAAKAQSQGKNRARKVQGTFGQGQRGAQKIPSSSFRKGTTGCWGWVMTSVSSNCCRKAWAVAKPIRLGTPESSCTR